MRLDVTAEVGRGPISSTSTHIPDKRIFQLLLLTFAAAAAAYARTAVSPIQEAMRIALALTDNEVALLQGPALALPMVLAAIPLGLAIDRRSRVRLLFVFALCNMIGSLITAFAPNFVTLFLARCLVGLTAPATAIAVMSMIADLYAPSQRGRANMVMTLGQVGGMSAAFALGGALLAMEGSRNNGWQSAMVGLAMPLLLAVFVVLMAREPARTSTVAAVHKLSIRQSCRELWRYRSVALPLLAGGVMIGMADVAVLIWGAPTLSRNFALSPNRIGSIMAIVLLVSGLAGPILGGLFADFSQRTGGPRRTMYVLSGLTFLSLPAGLFGIMPGIASVSTLLTIFMTIGSAFTVIWGALFTIVIPNELRGLCMMVSTAAGVLFGLGVAPVMVSFLSSVIGGPQMIGTALMFVCVSMGVLGTVTLTFGTRYISRAAAHEYV